MIQQVRITLTIPELSFLFFISDFLIHSKTALSA
jgi:hypothetical protein